MILEINCKEGNSRNSEGSFVELKDGRIMLIYTQYRNAGGGDHCTADMVKRIYTPADDTWSEPEIVVENKAMNVMSASLLRLQSGKIAFIHGEKSAVPVNPAFKDSEEGGTLLQQGTDFVDCRPWFRFSEDEGETWSDPVPLTNVPPIYLVANNDRLVQLKSGRLLFPVSAYQYKTLQGVAYCYISDDEGKTWRRSQQSCYPPQWLGSGLTEPGVIELADGTIMMWARTSGGCQYKMFSYDGGDTWSVPMPASEFLSSESPMSMKRNPWTNELIAIWNDHDPRWGVAYQEGSWGRTPLVMAYSKDEGKTWYGHTIVESEPNRGYCYTAILFSAQWKDHVLLEYCWGANHGVLNSCKVNFVKLKD